MYCTVLLCVCNTRHSVTLSTMAAVLPYQFEPESDPESDNGAEDANDERDFSRRMDQDISQWCTCGNCATMPNEVENVCCREIPKGELVRDAGGVTRPTDERREENRTQQKLIDDALPLTPSKSTCLRHHVPDVKESRGENPNEPFLGSSTLVKVWVKDLCPGAEWPSGRSGDFTVGRPASEPKQKRALRTRLLAQQLQFSTLQQTGPSRLGPTERNRRDGTTNYFTHNYYTTKTPSGGAVPHWPLMQRRG
ncbi:unnamed protein product [Arctogadus glacialis]